jgi:hypothetical protein
MSFSSKRRMHELSCRITLVSRTKSFFRLTIRYSSMAERTKRGGTRRQADEAGDKQDRALGSLPPR